MSIMFDWSSQSWAPFAGERRFSKSRGLSASVSFLPLPHPLFLILLSPQFRAGKIPFLGVSLLLNPTETLASRLSESRIELRNLQILKKILDKSSPFLSSKELCEPKSLEVASNIAGVEQIRPENLWLWSTWRPFDSNFEGREHYWWLKFVSFVVGDSQISLK